MELDPNAVVEYYDETGLILEATLEDLEITEAHIHVDASLANIPQTGGGNPKPGKFEYKHEDTDPLVVIEDTVNGDNQKATLVIDPTPVGDPLYIAVHIGVEGTHTDFVPDPDVVTEDVEESAWGDGTGFLGKNWAMYIVYSIPTAPREFSTRATRWGAIKAK